MTRILSVFNFLKRVGFAILLLGGETKAQPFEAPDTLWTRTFEYDGGVNAYGAFILPNGRVVISGSLGDTGLGQGLFLLQLSSTGQQIDFDLYPDDLFVVNGGYLALTADGGFALAGTLDANNNDDFRIDKLDANGELVWEQDYSMLGIQKASSIVGLPDGNLLLGGASTRASQPTKFFWMKVNGQNGDTLWTQQFGNPGVDIDGVRSIAIDSDGSFFSIGTTNYHDSTDRFNVLLVKSSPEGEIEFSQTFGRLLTDDGESIDHLRNGNLIIGGGSGTQDTTFATWEAYHLCTTPMGDTVWTEAHRYGNGNFDKTHKVIRALGDGFYSIGKTANDGYQIRISRHNGEDELEWVGFYGLSFSSSNIHADAVDTLGRFAVAYTYTPGVLSVFMTEPDPALSSDRVKPWQPSALEIAVAAFPNPFNAVTTLRIVTPLHVVADLTIVNPLGQSVTTLFHGRTDTSPFFLSFDGSHLSSGAYFACLQIEQSQTSTQTQLILLK